MELIKILAALLLLLLTGNEYVKASKELGVILSPGICIACTIILVFSAWLLGSGLNHKEKFNIFSIRGTKYILTSFFIFVISIGISIFASDFPLEKEVINGIEIPLYKCIMGTKKLIDIEEDRKVYCHCLAEKVSADSIMRKRFGFELKNGDFYKLIKTMKEEEQILDSGIEDCFQATTVKWTDAVSAPLRKMMIEELKGTDFEKTHDLEKYCDCLIQEYKKRQIREIMSEEFINSDEAINLEYECGKKSKQIKI